MALQNQYKITWLGHTIVFYNLQILALSRYTAMSLGPLMRVSAITSILAPVCFSAL